MKIGLLFLLLLMAAITVKTALSESQNVTVTIPLDIDIFYSPPVNIDDKGNLFISIRNPGTGEEYFSLFRDDMNTSFFEGQSFAAQGSAEIPITDVFVNVTSSAFSNLSLFLNSSFFLNNTNFFTNLFNITNSINLTC